MKRSSNIFRKALWLVLITSFLFLNTSCVTSDSKKLKDDYVKKSEVQKQIDELKKKHEEELAAATTAISTQKDTIITGQDLQLQTVSDFLYGANTAFSFYTEPNRIDLIINNRVKEADAATGKKATAEAMERENKRLADELDETKTSLEDLKKKHDTVVKENSALAEQTDSNKKELNKLQKELSDMALRHSTELNDAQTEMIFLQEEINRLEKARGDDSEARQKLERDAKMKGMAVCGVLALSCVAGAIWMPAFKSKFVAGAAAFGGCAALILYIQPWMVATVAGISILAVIVKMAYEHHAVDKTATNAIHYIEDNKPTNTDTLKEYMGKYSLSSDGGKPSIVVDPDVEKVIQKKLMDSQKL